MCIEVALVGWYSNPEALYPVSGPALYPQEEEDDVNYDVK